MNEREPTYREFKYSRRSAKAWIVTGVVIAALSPVWWYFYATGDDRYVVLLLPFVTQAVCGAAMVMGGINMRRMVSVVSRHGLSISGGVFGMGKLEIGWADVLNWRVTAVPDPLGAGDFINTRMILALRIETKSGRSLFINEDAVNRFEEFVEALRHFQPKLEILEPATAVL